MEIPPQTVQLHYTRVDQVPPRRQADYPALLDEAERQRWQRFRFERDRDLFLVSRALVRTVLAGYRGIEPAALTFVHNPRGKPELADPGRPPLRFNLSHSDGLAVCAVVREARVGVDVEGGHRQVDQSLAERFFAPQEARWLGELEGADHREGFLALWTLKEAYLKARGEGLSLGLDNCIFALEPLTLTLTPAAQGDPARWHLARHRLGDHRLALVVERQGEGTPRVVLQPTVP